MKDKWLIYSSIFQILFGTFGVLALTVVRRRSAEVTIWYLTLVLSVAFILTGIVGIIDYARKTRR